MAHHPQSLRKVDLSCRGLSRIAPRVVSVIRSVLRLLAVALLGVALSAPLTGTALARTFPDHISLPDGFQPEGITIGRHATAYLGSLANGDIYAVSLRTGESRLISKGLGPNFPSVGLKIDNRGLLFVSGGPAGTGRVIDVRTGKIIRNYTFTTEPSFINDVVLTRRYAWFTDSQQAQLYGVPLGRHGTPGGQASVVNLPLTGDWEQVTGLNANGIAQTPDRKALLVVNSTTGLLFRVNPRTGERPRSICAAPCSQMVMACWSTEGLCTRSRTRTIGSPSSS